MYCGVRFGLSLGDELVDLVEAVEDGLVITFDQGFLEDDDVVGVALRLVLEATDEAVGDAIRLSCQRSTVSLEFRFSMDIVC